MTVLNDIRNLPGMSRTIVHLDADAFFASVEQAAVSTPVEIQWAFRQKFPKRMTESPPSAGSGLKYYGFFRACSSTVALLNSE